MRANDTEVAFAETLRIADQTDKFACGSTREQLCLPRVATMQIWYLENISGLPSAASATICGGTALRTSDVQSLWLHSVSTKLETLTAK